MRICLRCEHATLLSIFRCNSGGNCRLARSGSNDSRLRQAARLCGLACIATSYSPSAFIRMPAMPSPWASAQA